MVSGWLACYYSMQATGRSGPQAVWPACHRRHSIVPTSVMLLLPVQAAVAAGTWQAPELGSAACKQLFCLDPAFTYLNHGSYGAAYALALQVQTWYRQQLEREPVRFMETSGLAALVCAVADVAGFVGADWRDVVPVTNATTGVNAVLQSLQLKKGDLILMANTTYAAVSGWLGVRTRGGPVIRCLTGGRLEAEQASAVCHTLTAFVRSAMLAHHGCGQWSCTASTGRPPP